MSSPNGNGGWICLHRKMLETSWYGNPNASIVAVHLLLSATHRDYETFFGSRRGTLLRGQYITGRKHLAKQTGLSEWQAYRGLIVLEKAGFLHRSRHTNYTVITICNYNAYQDKEPNVAQQFAHHEADSAHHTPSECTSHPPEMHTKQQLTINNKQYIVREFECLWSDYPKKDGKKEAFRHFNAQMNRTKREDWEKTILQYKQALMNYNNSEPVRRGEARYIKNGATWFHNWEDWITDPTSTPSKEMFDKIGAKYGLKRNTSAK